MVIRDFPEGKMETEATTYVNVWKKNEREAGILAKQRVECIREQSIQRQTILKSGPIEEC